MDSFDVTVTAAIAAIELYWVVVSPQTFVALKILMLLIAVQLKTVEIKSKMQKLFYS